jgi:dipeptide/tripeptide permease
LEFEREIELEAAVLRHSVSLIAVAQGEIKPSLSLLVAICRETEKLRG